MSAARRSWELRGDLAALFLFVTSVLADRHMQNRTPHLVTRTTPPAIMRRGITLVETVIAISLTTFAAGALLTSLTSTIQVGTDAFRTSIANGLADQLMDEIASVKFPSATTTATGVGRTGFDDIDDYNGYSVSPPQARSGAVIGTDDAAGTRPVSFRPDPRLYSRYRQQVTVEKITESTGTSWNTVTTAAPLRRVTVTISYTDAQGVTTPLASQIRVFSNVAVAP